jgi:electron transport complex protein RnfD
MNTPFQPELILTTSPFIKDRASTRWIMWQVNLALAPVVAAAFWYYGLAAILILLVSTGGAVLTERLAQARTANMPGNLGDGSAALTGLLVGLTLPPGIPLWMAFVGGVVAIGLGKLIFGGLGSNMFNPALVGRAFLQAAFPASLTSWSFFGAADRFTSVPGSLLTAPFVTPGVDAVSAATPLASMFFDHTPTAFFDLASGATAGSLGESSAWIIAAAGLYLAARRVINPRIPVAMLGSAAVFAGILYWIDPATYPSPAFHLLSGGLMLGAVFMATDPVTSPLTQRGCWIFGAGIGVLVVLIRQFGGLPEGVMYAILFMNACTPLINRLTQPRTFGTSGRVLFTR